MRIPWPLAIIAVACAPEVGPADVTVAPHDTIGSLLVVSWRQALDASAWVEFCRPGEAWQRSPAMARIAGTHEELVLGMPYDTEVEVQVVVDDPEGAVASEPLLARTEPVPEGLPVPELVHLDADAVESSGHFLVGSINGDPGGWVGGQYWTFLIDRAGQLVWAAPTPDQHWTLYAGISADGSALLWDEATYWSDFDSGLASVVHRIRIDGTVVHTHPTPGLHHAFAELADGSLAWAAADGFTDETLEVLSPDGDRQSLWRCSTDWPQALELVPFCQANTVTWHPEPETFLLSYPLQHTVIEVGRDGAMGRAWGQTEGAAGFADPDTTFWWQHGSVFTAEGTLLVSTKDQEEGHETLVREYRVDAEGPLEALWSFGGGEGLYAETAGEAHRLANGNTLHNYGSDARLREVTPDGEVVWEVDWDADYLLGRTVFVEDLYALAP